MPKTDLRKRLGGLGERLAEKWLTGKGYRLVWRNFTMLGGQIDLIMYSPQGNLVFFEVKTRLCRAPGPSCPNTTQPSPPFYNDFPIERRIGAKQLLTLRRAASHFLALNPFPFASWQLDLLWITLRRGPGETLPASGGRPLAKIRHYQDVLSV